MFAMTNFKNIFRVQIWFYIFTVNYGDIHNLFNQ